MSQGSELFKNWLIELLAPKGNKSVEEWAEESIILPEQISQRHGKYSTDFCAYVSEVLEDFRDPTLSHSSICWGAQCFKSTTMMVGVGYRISEHPANIMWMMPNLEILRSFAETKWTPIVEASPILTALKSKVADKFKKLEQQYERCILYFIATGSQKNLKGRSVEIILFDEIDDIEEEWNKKGMSAVGMAESRTKSFIGSKIFKTGTPSILTGAIWQAFLDGDQRLYFVDCPHCKKEMTLEFSPEYTREYFPEVPAARVVWGKDAGAQDAKGQNGEWDLKVVEETARIECPHCKGLMNEGDKLVAVKNGRWKATNNKAMDGRRSRRLPSIYSPHQKTSIAALSVKFLQYLKQPGGLRNFLNEELALPWKPKGSSVSATDVKAVSDHSPEYLIGEIPKDDVAFLKMTVDVQQDSFWWVVRAWFGDSSSALIDYGQAIGWSEIKEISDKGYRHKTSPDKTTRCSFCLIDSGYRARRTGGVYSFCLGPGAGKFFPTKGRGDWSKTIAETDIDYNGQPLKLIQYHDDMLKTELYITRLKQRAYNNWWIPRNFGRDYEIQMTDEYLGKKKNERGYEEDIWLSKEDCNHLGDCEKMQLLMPSLIGPDGLKALAEKQQVK